MEELLLQPLEFAVLDIIANSHLTNGGKYSYVPARNVDKIGFIPDPKFPYITAVSYPDTYGEELVMVLAVTITIPFPNMTATDTEYTRFVKAVDRAQGHHIDLVEILQWLTGKVKLSNGKPLYEFDIDGDAQFIIPDFDPVIPPNEVQEGKNRVTNIINLGFQARFRGHVSTICCTRLNPAEAGSAWSDAIADISGL